MRKMTGANGGGKQKGKSGNERTGKEKKKG